MYRLAKWTNLTRDTVQCKAFVNAVIRYTKGLITFREERPCVE